MRSRTIKALAVGGVVGLLSVGVGLEYAFPNDHPDAKRDAAEADAELPADVVPDGDPELPADADRWTGDDYKATTELPDGRKVEIRYVTKKGLGERHFDPKTKKWSETKLIYKTKTHPCQGIELTDADGTVAATAAFGLFCYDGEPPEYSVAAVGTGELTEWDTYRQGHSEYWSKVQIAGAGADVFFVRNDERTVETLRWSKKDGYSKLTEKPRRKKLSKLFVGSWKATDGTQRVAIQERGNRAVATFFSQRGERCVARVDLSPYTETSGLVVEVSRVKGDKSRSCPPYEVGTFLELDKASTELSLRNGDPTFFKRTEPNDEERRLPSPRP
jgi:hypothetical protein